MSLLTSPKGGITETRGKAPLVTKERDCMSSILTNTSAMVALQTLKGINSNLTKTQDEISTGKTVASAKDNSAVWAISKVMEADVNGFKAISGSLSLGECTVAVGRQAAETGDRPADADEGKDRRRAGRRTSTASKIQADIDRAAQPDHLGRSGRPSSTA